MTHHKLLLLLSSHTNHTFKYTVLRHNLEKLVDQSLVEQGLDLGLDVDIDIVVLASNFNNGGDVMGLNGLCREFGVQLVEMENDGWLDFGKWKRFLDSRVFKKNKYDRVVLMNDSIILTDSLTPFFQFLMDPQICDIELVGYCNSHQLRPHYPSFLFSLSVKAIPTFLDFVSSVQQTHHHKPGMVTVIHELETKMVTHGKFASTTCFVDLVSMLPSVTSSMTTGSTARRGNCHQESILFSEDRTLKKLYLGLLQSGAVPFVKIKKLYLRRSYTQSYPQPQFHTKPRRASKPSTKEIQQALYDFNPKEYSEFNPDLPRDWDEEKLRSHFIKRGLQEGRFYSRGKLPSSLDNRTLLSRLFPSLSFPRSKNKNNNS
jgi:hypothetical protein